MKEVHHMANEDKLKSILQEEINNLNHVIQVFNKNNNRVLRILKESIKLKDNVTDKIRFVEYMHDVARASVIFIHSTLETTLREIVRLKLKSGSDLSKISFIDVSTQSNKKEKITLSELAKYRGKTVDDIIENSIDNHLSMLSFNNTNDISSSILSIGLSKDKIEEYLPHLEAMMKKRHKIAHEGDMKRNSTELERIDVNEVTQWINTTGNFCEAIIKETVIENVMSRIKNEGISTTREKISKIIKVTVTDNYN